MNLLLDTHAFIWWDGEPVKLSPTVQSALQNPQNTIFLSVVSVWELQIKFQIGRLQLRQPIADIVDEQRRQNQLQILPVELPHVIQYGQLPLHHNDPFDRLLIAQALSEQIVLVSKDADISKYAVNTLW